MFHLKCSRQFQLFFVRLSYYYLGAGNLNSVVIGVVFQRREADLVNLDYNSTFCLVWSLGVNLLARHMGRL